MRNACRLPGGIESALFGRMVTADPDANIDAALHVAHSFTVHEEESESDYFVVVDDLQDMREYTGVDHIGETELTSGLVLRLCCSGSRYALTESTRRI